MITSMTTFARSSAQGDGWFCSMELRSVNGRYCDVHTRIPRGLAPLEDRINKTIKKRLRRGTIDFTLQFQGAMDETPNFLPDRAAARSWLTAAEQLAEELRFPARPDFKDLLAAMPGVIVMEQAPQDESALWERLEQPLERLLEQAEAMALREGADLERDIRNRLSIISDLLDQIDRGKREHLEAAQKALRERVEKLLQNVAIDPVRLTQESAIMADRLDITEEIVRASSHIERFLEYLDSTEPVGRRLDFLTQEIFREFNTMASKSCNSSISQAVVEVKGELEKIREQVQNIV